jgi:hypothetical protein
MMVSGKPGNMKSPSLVFYYTVETLLLAHTGYRIQDPLKRPISKDDGPVTSTVVQYCCAGS